MRKHKARWNPASFVVCVGLLAGPQLAGRATDTDRLQAQVAEQSELIDSLQAQRNALIVQALRNVDFTLDLDGDGLAPALGPSVQPDPDLTVEQLEAANIADFVQGVLDNGGTQAQADTLMRIADCELREWRLHPERDNAGLNRDGSIDIGAVQINARVWGPSWAVLQPGRDFDADWRTTYWSGWMGVHILRVQGLSAWSASAGCHGLR